MSCGLRDVLEFEKAGTAAVLVATDVFAEAADRQAALLGQPAARRVFVAHPVQDRTDEELWATARDVADEIERAVTRPGV